MPGKLNFNDFERIQSQCNIVSVISSYLTLVKRGKNYWGVCPFHDDKNPSMSVSEDKQIYKCFSCNHTGNVFTFIRDYERVPILQAVKKAAQICNVPVPELEHVYETRKISESEAASYALLNDLLSFYTYTLKTMEGQSALKYLINRQLSDEVINHFKLGFSPLDGKKTIEFLKARGHSVDLMIECGIAVRTNDGIVDPLRGRLIFPIANKENQVIAFSGRILTNDKDLPKYVNTQETKLFHKSDVLYNYYNAYLNAQKEKVVYIVEGFMDVIALHRGGIKATLATMGTALTPSHVKEIKKLATNIRLLFDSDEAGQNATMKCMELFDEQNIKYQIIKPIRPYKDVDEAINKAGSEKLKELLSNELSPMDYRLLTLQNRINLSDYEGKREFIRNALIFLSKSIKDKIGIDFYLKRISDISLIDLDIIKSEFTKIERPVTKINIKVPQSNGKSLHKYDKVHIQYILLMFDNPDAIIKYQRNEVHLFRKNYERLAYYILNYFEKNAALPKPESLMTMIDNPEVAGLLTDIVLNYEEPLLELNEAVYQLEKSFIEDNYEMLVNDVIKSSIPEKEKAMKLDDLKRLKNINIAQLNKK